MTLQEFLDAAALVSTPIPIAGDLVGLGADSYRMASDPKERTWLNAGLMAAGALPFVPSMGAVKGAMKAADSVGDGLDLVRANKHKMAKRNATGLPVGVKKLSQEIRNNNAPRLWVLIAAGIEAAGHLKQTNS